MTQVRADEQVLQRADPGLDEPDEPGLIAGRPVEDRSFEAVEAGVGLAAGIAIGSAIAGPIGAAVGGIVGIAGGIATGEAVERAMGRVATTTDATRP
jgi:hypothetical protein